MAIIIYSKCPSCDSDLISPKLTAKDYTVSAERFEIWQCGKCSMRFTQNIPDKFTIAKYYRSENYISHTDTKKGFINSLYHIIRKRTLDQKRNLIQHFTGMQKGRLLDIGAGTGAFTAHLKNAGWQSVGLEPDEDTRHRALALYGFSLLESNQLFKLPANSFDAVTMWHVLEHVHDLHEYMEQIRTVLQPAGKAFIAVPNYTSPDAQTYGQYWAGYDVPRHLYHFSPSSMKSLLQKHGMKLCTMKPMWYDSFYVSMLSEQYKHNSPGHITAFWNGLLSDIKTMGNKEKCSSLIYVIEK